LAPLGGGIRHSFGCRPDSNLLPVYRAGGAQLDLLPGSGPGRLAVSSYDRSGKTMDSQVPIPSSERGRRVGHRRPQGRRHHRSAFPTRPMRRRVLLTANPRRASEDPGLFGSTLLSCRARHGRGWGALFLCSLPFELPEDPGEDGDVSFYQINYALFSGTELPSWDPPRS
jgi:hypothetical protein